MPKRRQHPFGAQFDEKRTKEGRGDINVLLENNVNLEECICLLSVVESYFRIARDIYRGNSRSKPPKSAPAPTCKFLNVLLRVVMPWMKWSVRPDRVTNCFLSTAPGGFSFLVCLSFRPIQVDPCAPSHLNFLPSFTRAEPSQGPRSPRSFGCRRGRISSRPLQTLVRWRAKDSDSLR